MDRSTSFKKLIFCLNGISKLANVMLFYTAFNRHITRSFKMYITFWMLSAFSVKINVVHITSLSPNYKEKLWVGSQQ